MLNSRRVSLRLRYMSEMKKPSSQDLHEVSSILQAVRFVGGILREDPALRRSVNGVQESLGLDHGH